jgi:hypothetical protein
MPWLEAAAIAGGGKIGGNSLDACLRHAAYQALLCLLDILAGSTVTTAAPASASPLAMAKPIPDVEPVMIACRSVYDLHGDLVLPHRSRRQRHGLRRLRRP